MICEFCESQTVKKKVNKHHWLHGKLYIIENIEAEVCTESGERYFHTKILYDTDRILETKHDAKEKIEVAVVSL